MLSISIVIVSYRVKFFLEQTLRAVQEALDVHTAREEGSAHPFGYEIMVVDNHSGDDTVPFVKARFPHVKFIENKDNVGFARANNQAIMQARGEYTIILNPDTIVTPQCIGDCMAWMRSHPECGAIGLRMVDGNGHFLPESKRAFPTPWVSFCKIFGLSKIFPRSRWFAKYHLRFLSEDEPHAVDILSGACMFCRTSLLQRIHGFDEDFFMYGEDIDLSYRITREGYRNFYLPVSMLHYKGESTKKDSVRYVRVFYQAMLIFYRKHFPGFGRVMYPFIKLGVWGRQSLAMACRHSQGKGQPADCRAGWVILSQHPQEVARVARVQTYSTAIPPSGTAHVLLDDASLNYQQIVDTIDEHARKGLFFHIFSSRNGIVISPKMCFS